MNLKLKRPNPLFQAAAFLSAVFVVTIFAMVATMFGDPDAPAAKALDRHGGALIAVEVAGILVTGFLALAVDRRHTLRTLQTDTEESSHRQVEAVSGESGKTSDEQSNDSATRGTEL